MSATDNVWKQGVNNVSELLVRVLILSSKDANDAKNCLKFLLNNITTRYGTDKHVLSRLYCISRNILSSWSNNLC